MTRSEWARLNERDQIEMLAYLEYRQRQIAEWRDGLANKQPNSWLTPDIGTLLFLADL